MLERKERMIALGCYADVWSNAEANEQVSEFVRNKIRGIVQDPDVAEKLCPKDPPIGTRRIIMDTGYFEIFNQPNVTLVDVRSAPIEAIRPGARNAACPKMPRPDSPRWVSRPRFHPHP